MGISSDRLVETLQAMQEALKDLTEEFPPPGGGTWGSMPDDSGPADEDPLHDDEDEALRGDLRVSLRETLADHLSQHLAGEYRGRPEEISVPRVTEYMGQLASAVQDVLADQSWVSELVRTAIYRARKSA